MEKSRYLKLEILAAYHLAEPLIHLTKTILERPLQSLTRAPHRILLRPVGIAVVKDQVHVRQELLFISIFVGIHFSLHRAQIHRLLNLLQIIGHAILNGIYGLLEWAD
jgi:hypothetical protein